MNDINKEVVDLDKILELYKKIDENIQEYNKLADEVHHTRVFGTYRNGVRTEYLLEVEQKYGRDKILNIYGDLFYIVENREDEETYICRRIRWDLELGKEIYTIYHWVDYSRDDEGGYEYEGTFYELTNIEIEKGTML